MCASFLMRETIALQRAAANWMVYCTPSMIHPSSSFVVSHVLSPWFIFRCDMGSSPWCFVNSGGGKTEWIPTISAFENFSRCCRDKLFVKAQKSSTNTSSRFVVNAVAWSQGSMLDCSSILGRNGWSGRGMEELRRLSITSLAVSVAAQKYGGDSHQPI